MLFYSKHEWDIQKENELLNLKNLVDINAHSIDSYLSKVELSILQLRDKLIATGQPINLNKAAALLKDYHRLNPELANIAFSNHQGEVLLASGNTVASEASEPSFIKYKDEIEQLSPKKLGMPIVNPLNREWVMPLRIPLIDDDRLRYIITANFPMNILQEFWKDAPITRWASIGIMRDDGYLISRYPIPRNIEINEVYNRPRTGRLIRYIKEKGFPLSGYVEGESSLLGPDFLFAFNRFEHYPVTLFAAIPMSELHTKWIAEIRDAWMIFSILLVVVFVFYRQHTKAQGSWELEQIELNKGLEESIAFSESIINNSEIAMWVSDNKGTLIKGNAALYRSLCITEDEILGRYNIFEDNIIQEHGLMPTVKDVFEKGQSTRFTINYDTSLMNNLKLARKTKCTLVVTISPIVNNEGKVTNAIIQHWDITELKKSEEIIRRQSGLLDLIFKHSLDSLVLLDRDYNFIRVSDSYARACNRDLSEFQGKNHFELYPSSLKEDFDEAISKDAIYIKNARPFIFPDHPEMGITYWDIAMQPVRGADNNIEVIILTLRDVTKRKQAEERINQLLSEKNAILDNAKIGISMVIDRVQIWANKSMAEMFGYSLDEMAGKDTRMLYPSQETYEDIGNNAYPVLSRGDIYRTELQMRHSEGTLFMVKLTGKAIYPEDLTKGTIWLLEDISEEKKKEEALKKSMHEKEILLREVHHRVKNNLAIVSSLISLQSKHIQDNSIKAMLEDSMLRIRAMALVHERLYQTSNFASIDFREYIHSIMGELLYSYNMTKNDINIELHVKETMLDLNTAIPCGLLINELLTNSFKYAFTNRESGEITVGLVKEGDMCRLTVRDNGIGLPEGFEYMKAKTLGLQLVNALTKQLEGTMEIKSINGTEVSISFPCISEKV